MKKLIFYGLKIIEILALVLLIIIENYIIKICDLYKFFENHPLFFNLLIWLICLPGLIVIVYYIIKQWIPDNKKIADKIYKKINKK